MSTLLFSSCFLHFKYYLPASLCLWKFFEDTGGSAVKNLLANAGDVGSIPGSGRSLGVGNNNLLQYSCLEISIDRGAWRAIVHGVTHTFCKMYFS